MVSTKQLVFWLQNMLTRWDELKTSMQDNALLTTGIVIENIARAEPMPIAQASAVSIKHSC